uniref:Protein YIPF n=1 Tax=Caenorhabditis tropicalis TaxID=1561998 RepID=A0A1I7UGV7_9PELO
MVTSASTLIFLYVVIVPLLLYGLLWNRRSEMLHPYVDLVCLYGYSLAIFIPVTFLWIINMEWFRWVLIFVSVSLSGTVLGRAIWPAVKNDVNKMVAFGTVATVVVLHFLLAFTFKVYFFDSMHQVPPPLL